MRDGMRDTASMREHAIALMREALLLLDEAGEDIAASHLQFAMDMAAGVKAARPTDDRGTDTL
tara:strand:+ start:33346 stop:33534 length:189 start_codon:yes stop_codon:yes gene_type:complete